MTTPAGVFAVALACVPLAAFAQAGEGGVARLAAAAAEHPDDAALARALARGQLDRGEVDAALASLRQFSARHPERPAEWSLLLGRALYTKGDLIAAKAALDQAIAARSDAALAHFYLGLVDLRLGKNSDAARALKRAEELDPSLAERARNASRPLRPSWRRALERVALQVRVGAEYDSNATLEGDEDLLSIPGNGSDSRTLYQGAVAVSLLHNDWVSASLGCRFDQTLQQDLDQFDVQSHSAWLSGAVALSPEWFARAEGGGARVRLDRAAYLASANLGASIGFERERWGLFELRASAERRDYTDEPALPSLVRNGWRGGASLKYARSIALWAPALLSAQISYARTRTDGEKDLFGFDPAFESHLGSLDVGLRAPLPLKMRLDARLGLAREAFDAENVIDFLSDNGVGDPNPDRRLDHAIDAQLSLTRHLTEWLELEVRLRETRHFSNVDLYDWDRLMIGTQLRMHWQGQ